MVDLYNINDGVHGRDGGPYLDVEQAKAEEVRRAAIEGREPDFTNLVSVGAPLVTADQLIQQHNNTRISRQDQEKFTGEITAPVVATVVVATVEDAPEVVEDEEVEPSEPPITPEGIDL